MPNLMMKETNFLVILRLFELPKWLWEATFKNE